MARGNMGNLAQHFVAIEVIRNVVSSWDRPSDPIEFIDCYAMGAWEALKASQTPQRRLFEARCNGFVNGKGGFVGNCFLRAWKGKYGRRRPADVAEWLYPNTTVLLRTAFPNQRLRMRLHDVVDDNFQQLTRVARQIGPEDVQVDRDWTQSRLIHGCPAPRDRPVVVMLDPHRIVPNDHNDANIDGYLTPRLIEYLIGSNALAIDPPSRTAPCLVILCSYSAQDPEAPCRLMDDVFVSKGWQMERLVAGPFPDIGALKSHVVGVASVGVHVPVLGSNLQEAWNTWQSMQEGAA